MTMCDFYPVISDDKTISEAIPHLIKLVSYPNVTALRLCITKTPSLSALKELTHLLYQHDIALILAPSHSHLIEHLPLDKIDGIHLNNLQDLKTTLTIIQKKKLTLQTGCFCTTLDEAMCAGEQGADYIAFPAEESASIAQWSLMAQLPSIADNSNDLHLARKVIHSGTDFLSFTLQLNQTDLKYIADLNTLLS